MINLLSIQKTLLVTGAKSDNPSVYIPPNPTIDPPPIFKDLPSFQVTPSQPMFEVKVYDASLNHIHGGINYNPTPNLTIGANAAVDKHGNIPYYGINGNYNF